MVPLAKDPRYHWLKVGTERMVKKAALLTVISFLILPQVIWTDFSTPENTLDEYIRGLRNGDRSVVAKCFDPPANDFYLPGPISVQTYSIVKKVTFGNAEVKRWNTTGIIPAAKKGDVDLRVKEIVEGKIETFHYLLRKFGKDWKIISHSGEGPQ